MNDQETPENDQQLPVAGDPQPGEDGVVPTGEPPDGADGERQRPNPEGIKYARRRDMAIGLLYRIRVQGLLYGEAFRQVHAPRKLKGTDKTHQEGANRLIKWFRENYSEEWQEYLDRACVGRHAITDTLRQMLHATKFCPHTKRQIPDWTARANAVRYLIQINPEIINVMRRIRGGQDAPVGDPNAADAEEISMIVSGKKFKTTAEWREFARQVNEREAERQAAIAKRERKAASDSIAEADGEADGKPFTAEEMI